MFEILQFLIGNVHNFKKLVDTISSTEKIEEIDTVFFDALTDSLSSYKGDGDQKILSIQIVRILRSQRKKVITLLNEIGINDSPVYEAPTETQRIENVATVLTKIICTELDEDLGKVHQLLYQVLGEFRTTVINKLSTGQGIYFALKGISDVKNELTNLSLDVGIVKKQVANIGDTITSGVSNMTSLVDKLHNTLENFTPKENPILDTMIKKQIDRANKCFENCRYKDAIGEYHDAIQIVKHHQNQDGGGSLNKIYLNIASCYEQLGEPEKRKEYLIKIINNSTLSLIAIYAEYLLDFLEGKKENLDDIHRRIIQFYPESVERYLVEIEAQKFQSAKDLKSWIENIPEPILNNKHIQLTIASKFYFFGDKEKHLELIRRVHENFISVAPQVIADLALNLSISLVDRLIKNPQVLPSEEERNTLAESIDLFLSAWKILQNHPSIEKRTNVLINISLIYVVLGESSTAHHYVDQAISIGGGDLAISQKIAYLFWDEEIEGCIKLIYKLEDIHQLAIRHQIPMTVVILLSSENEKDWLYAKGIIAKGITDVQNVKNYFRAIFVFIKRSYEKKELQSISQEILDLVNKSYPNQPEVLLFNLMRLSSKESFEILDSEFLESIFRNYTTLENIYKLELASILHEHKDYNRAINILLQIEKNDEYYLYAAQILYDSYKENFDQKEALELCKTIYNQFGIVKPFTRAYLSILLDLRDYSILIKVGKEYLQRFKTDNDVKFLLANVYVKSGQIEEIEKLGVPDSIQNFSLSDTKKLIHLYIALGKLELLRPFMYEIWRKDQSEEACTLIFNLMVHTNSIIDAKELKVKEVLEESVIIFSSAFDKGGYYVLLNRPDVDKRNNEINQDDPIYHLLLGAKQGDKISLGVNPISQKETIITIDSILLLDNFACLQATEKISVQYANQSGIYSISPSTPEEGAKQIFDFIKGQKPIFLKTNKFKLSSLEYYRQFKFPIGAVSTALRIPQTVLWHSFVDDDRIGIYSEIPFQTYKLSREETLKKNGFCLTTTSILGLYYSFKQSTGNLISFTDDCHITQSTFDEFIDVKRMLSSIISATELFYQIHDESGNKVIFSTSQSSIDKLQSNIDEIIDWIKNNCTFHPTPIRSKNKSSSEGFVDSEKVFGQLTLDSINLSIEKNLVFVNDDFVTNQHAISTYQLDSFSSAHLISIFRMTASNKQTLYSIDLALLEYCKINYKIISPDFAALFNLYANNIDISPIYDSISKAFAYQRDILLAFGLIIPISLVDMHKGISPERSKNQDVLDTLFQNRDLDKINTAFMQLLSQDEEVLFGVNEYIKSSFDFWFQLKILRS